MFRDAYDFAKHQGELLRERTAAEQRFKLAADAIRDSLRATLDYGQSSYPDTLGSLDANKVVDLIVREWASLQARRAYAPVEGDKTT